MERTTDCDEARSLLWDRDELAPAVRGALERHLAVCADCRETAAEIGPLRQRLRLPVRTDAPALARRALVAVETTLGRDATSAARRWRPAFALFAGAAVAVLAILTFVPVQTEALSLTALTTQHRLCLIEGHNKNFRCGDTVAFAEMTMQELGLTPRPFEVPKETFVTGDVCRIGGTTVAHALLNVDGKQVSYFRLYDAADALMREGAWTAAGEGIWTTRREGRLVVMRRFADRDYGLYTGGVTLEQVVALWRDREERG